jgi:hypothetical protein
VFLFQLRTVIQMHLLLLVPRYRYCVADPECLSRIRILSISDPGSWVKTIPDPGSRKYDPGCSSRFRIPDPDLDFLPVPHLGSKGQKAPDPGSGSATLHRYIFCIPLSLNNSLDRYVSGLFWQ